jgi:hypothetical protein
MRPFGGLMKGFERWTLERLTERPRCSVEPSMSCIPLRGDPICMACFEAELENGAKEAPDDNP